MTENIGRMSGPRSAWFKVQSAVLSITNGRCFYCGGSVEIDGQYKDGRDWLFVKRPSRMVREHKIPVSRGGSDDDDNIVPACGNCNNTKFSHTINEFRFIRGLRVGDLSFVFPFEPTLQSRDWLCCHSAEQERALLIHNIPSSADAYGKRVPIRLRNRQTNRGVRPQ